MGRRRVQGGGDVSSLTSILPLARRCVESLCKSHVITPPPARACLEWGEEQSNRGGKGSWGRWRGPLTCSFTNALLVPHKLKPRHLVSFPTFVFSVSSLSLPAVCLSNHRPGTVWVNEGLGSTLPPTQASIHLGKDCPLLWWDTVAKPPISETSSVCASLSWFGRTSRYWPEPKDIIESGNIWSYNEIADHS